MSTNKGPLVRLVADFLASSGLKNTLRALQSEAAITLSEARADQITDDNCWPPAPPRQCLA